MLRRIKPRQVRMGMFVETIDGVWRDQPFWHSRFLLERSADVDSLRSSGVTAVIIDTTKGVDVVSPAPQSNAPSPARNEARLRQALETIEHSRPTITKMFANARIGNSVSVADVTQTAATIAACMTSGAKALMEITRLKDRDEYTFLHSVSVCGLMIHLARAIDLDEETVMLLGMGGLVHDIGKARLSLDILNKAGRLTEKEMRHIRLHPGLGHKLLAGQPDIPPVILEICLHHHERLDGKGYPGGLSDHEINLPVRICTICDVYDALTSTRPYKAAWTSLDAARFMLEAEGQFDRQLLMKFFHSLEI